MSKERRRSTRELTQDEKELWSFAMRNARVRAVAKAKALASQTVPAPPVLRQDDGQAIPNAGYGAATGSTSPDPSPASAARIPPLGTLDRRQTRQIAIGKTEIEARLDLHGMRQQEAYTALKSFLMSAQTRGCRLVLIITGKGGRQRLSPADEFRMRETGVLRRLVPRWLGEPELCRLVIGYGASDARHGGDGALYVRLRRARSN